MGDQIISWVRRMYYKNFMTGDDFYCPICKRSFSRLLPYGVVTRENAQCPGCKSLERHRSVWLYMEKNHLLEGNIKLLHVSPETVFFRHFSRNPQIEYHPVDKFEPGYNYPKQTRNVDITKTDFPDNSFDAIICSHVLEHIPADVTAMRELKRILRKGGWAIIMVPIGDIPETFEDFSITSPKARLKAFGQSDHVRLYGRDFIERLRTAGFTVERNDVHAALTKKEQERMALLPGDDIYFCTKPFAA